MKKVKYTALILALIMVLSLAMAPGALAAEDGTVTLVCDGSAGYKLAPEERDAGYEGEFYFTQYFGEDVPAGVKALVEAGGVTINGVEVPAKGEDGSYTVNVNGTNKLTGEVDDSNVADATVNAVGDLLKAAGTQVTLTVADGAVTQMDLFYTAGALIDHVEEADGIVTAYTGKDTVFTVGGNAGPMAPPSPVVEVTFDAANVENVTDGCIAVYWEGADGWHLKAADPVVGKLTDGADHQYIMLEDANGDTIECQDAAMYSRGFSDGNRPGQFVNTQMNFGLNDVEVTVWFIPGTLGTDNPMPIGITGLDNAHVRLERAIAFVQDVVDHTVVAESEEDAAAKAAEQDLGEDFHWVTEAVTVDHVSEITGKDSKGVLDMLNEKVAAAQALLDGEASPAELDQAAYELFIAMWGSSSDIGAVFAGAAEEGFYDVADAGAKALPPAVLM